MKSTVKSITQIHFKSYPTPTTQVLFVKASWLLFVMGKGERRIRDGEREGRLEEEEL